jgi:hypothetical protein
MKMIIGAELPDGYAPTHDDLAAASATLIAHALLPLFIDNMPEEQAKANVEGIVTELAFLFDDGEIQMGGKTYRPRLAFVDDAGNTLPGIAELTTMNDLASEPFNLAPEAQISFEEPEYDE